MTGMKILVIGGSRFVGWHAAQAALARGHQVTLFNRGLTDAPPSGAAQIVGDRKGDLAALRGGSWDAVMDTCGYLPAEVGTMADALSGAVERYLFVSSVSAYASFAGVNDESSALGRIDDPDTDVIDSRTYGPLKALCEQALLQRYGTDRSLILRPGLVVGPRDPTQRFTYWPARMARAKDGEPVLAPGSPTDVVQFIDARDLAAFMLDLLETGRHGTFNVVAPPGMWTMGEVLAACATAARSQPRLVWADAVQVERLGLKPWVDLPLWLPAKGEYPHFMRTDTQAAQAVGLHVRALDQTVADTLAWTLALPAERQAFTLAGLSPEREAVALQALG